MGNLGKVVYLTEYQAKQLFANGTITVSGTTVTYSENDLYVTPEDEPYQNARVIVITSSSGNTFTLQPCPITYNFGEKAELTVTVAATSQYHFMFSCPSSAATVLTITGITGKTGDTTLEAGSTYEVDVWAGIAFIQKIEVEAVT